MSDNSQTNKEAAQLKERCGQLQRAAEGALTWIGDNKERVGAEEQLLRRSIRRHLREAGKLGRASVRKLSVGVFGPSQSGKSYLMTTLGGKEAKLSVRLGDKDFDFLADINPGGDREATGVVTRFGASTIEGRADAPVVLRMLSRTDLLKIFSSAYMLNTRLDEDSTITVDDVSTHLQSFSDGPAIASDIGDFELDVAELRDYISDRCSDKAIVSILNTARYWDRATEIGSRLGREERVRLFSILWGEHELMTEIFNELDEILEKLNGAETVYAPVQSLIPRESGIQDVETLKQLGNPAEPFLTVMTSGGASLSLPRASLAALTAELQLRLQNAPHTFLNNTDLLDFPGLRPPVEIENPEQAILRGGSDDDEEDPSGENGTRMPIGNVILRGKVDFLFRKFSADYEINALLLVLKPGNQDVQSLPKIVRHWIDITHGETPERRRSRPASLFVILSWFDTMFGNKAGDKDPGRRFEVRIDSVMKFFKQAGEWPQTWTPGQPYQNVFWLRNPKIEQPGLMEYDGEWEKDLPIPDETFLDPKAEKKKDMLMKAHGANAVVRRHVMDPDTAFSEALRINDGGAEYIANNLEPVCTHDHKLEQITQQISRHEREMSDLLDRFYVSDNRAEQIRVRLEAGAELRFELEACQRRDRFASLQRLMQVTPDALLGLYQHTQTRREPEDESIPTAETRRREASIGPSTLEQRYARAVVAFWLDTSRERLVGLGARKHFRLTEEGVGTLVDELAAAAHREGIERSLSKELSDIMSFRDVSADRISLAAAEVINRFVDNISIEQQTRKHMNGAGAVELELPEAPTRYWEETDKAWIESFIDAIKKNAEAQVGGEAVDPEENARLGKLLELLGHSAANQPIETVEE